MAAYLQASEGDSMAALGQVAIMPLCPRDSVIRTLTPAFRFC